MLPTLRTEEVDDALVILKVDIVDRLIHYALVDSLFQNVLVRGLINDVMWKRVILVTPVNRLVDEVLIGCY